MSLNYLHLSRFPLLFTFFVSFLPCTAQSVKKKAPSSHSKLSSHVHSAKPHPAVAYNDFIVGEQGEIIKQTVVYSSIQAHSHDNLAIDSIRRGIVDRCQQAILNISAMPPLLGNTTFRDEAVAYFTQLQQQYSMDTQTLDFERETNTETVEAIEAYFKTTEVADDRMEAAQKRFSIAQQQFATSFKLLLVDTEDKFGAYKKRIAAVNRYQHRLVYARFRLQKPKAQIEDALDAKDPIALEAARLRLLQACQVTNAYLHTIRPFREKDSSYRDATISYVDFFEALASNQLITMVAFYSKRESDWTEEDIATFNRCIDYYNTNCNAQARAYTTAREAFEARNIPYIKTGQD